MMKLTILELLVLPKKHACDSEGLQGGINPMWGKLAGTGDAQGGF